MTPLERIMKLMEEQGATGNPKRHLILWGWDKLTDHLGTVSLEIKPPPRPVPKGRHIWVLASPNSPDLTMAMVLEDRGDKFWLQRGHAEFLAIEENIRWTAIPLRPMVIKRDDLWRFIGEEVAETWLAQRKRQAQNAPEPS